jgi:signal transduction histidine kinase
MDRPERSLTVARALTSELDLSTVLDEILETARELTHARYAAIGVRDDGRGGFTQFATAGIDDATRAAIGDLPRGVGVLGLMSDRPEPTRVDDISHDPRSYGFPVGHPAMRNFLGAPIIVSGRSCGSFYLTEKHDAEDFNDGDVDTIVALAERAAVAIESARLSGEATARRHELERALRAASAAMEIATAVGSETDLPKILELIVTRGRALVEADALLIWLRNADELRIAAVAGNARVPDGATIPIGASTAGVALGAERSFRGEDLPRMQIDPALYGMSQATTTLIVPLVYRGRGHGVLMAFDRLGPSASFDEDDQRALEAFAASAATAVATAQSVERQLLADALAVAESERRRWARELHDETLQGLVSLKLALVAALKAPPDGARTMLGSAVGQLEHDIAGLRGFIADLRPAVLDEFGLEPALRTLVAKVADTAGLRHTLTIELGGERLATDIETTAYRIAQEALTNVVRHAGARSVTVELRLDRGRLRLTVDDDGRGVDHQPAEGYGIVGMRERAALESGRLEVTGLDGRGTRVAMELPVG